MRLFCLWRTSTSWGKVALEFHVAASLGKGRFLRTHCCVCAGGITFGGTRSFNKRIAFCFPLPFLSKFDKSKGLLYPRYCPLSASRRDTLTMGEFSSFCGTSVSTWFTLTDRKLASVVCSFILSDGPSRPLTPATGSASFFGCSTCTSTLAPPGATTAPPDEAPVFSLFAWKMLRSVVSPPPPLWPLLARRRQPRVLLPLHHGLVRSHRSPRLTRVSAPACAHAALSLSSSLARVRCLTMSSSTFIQTRQEMEGNECCEGEWAEGKPGECV